jgi:carbon storage regulator
MLVLSRKVNERILIGEHVRITVVATRGNQVRIGIEAPDEVAIFREELIRPAETAPTPPPAPRAVVVDPAAVRSPLP